MKKQSFVLGMTAALVIACNLKSGSGDDNGPLEGRPAPTDLSFKLTDAPATVTLTGDVLANGTPVANAVISLNGQTATTGADGKFTLSVPTGRGSLKATAAGYVDFQQPIGLTSRSPAVHLAMVPVGKSQDIPATGGVVTTGTTTLTVTPASYPSGVTMTTTWLDRKKIGSMQGRPLFTDDTATYRTIGQLFVTASAQPVVPVELGVPVPADLGADETLAVVYLVDGEVKEQVPSSAVANGVATFRVPHFSMLSVVRRRLIYGAVYTGVAVAVVAWTLVKGTQLSVLSAANAIFPCPETIEPGDDLPPRCIAVANGIDYSFFAPNGSEVQGNGTVEVDTGDKLDATITCQGLCNLQAEVPPSSATDPLAPTGQALPSSKYELFTRDLEARRKLKIRTRTAVLGVRGTVFRLEQEACNKAESSAFDSVEVSEGAVDLSIGADDNTIPSGKSGTACEGCASPKQAQCDCDITACDAAGGKCLLCPNEPDGSFSTGTPFYDSKGRFLQHCRIPAALCCNAENDRFVSVCAADEYSKNLSVCQCAGTAAAGCATTNSVCVPAGQQAITSGTSTNPTSPTRPGGPLVLDCGVTSSNDPPCFGNVAAHRASNDVSAPWASTWFCPQFGVFDTDYGNCGSCNRACASQNDSRDYSGTDTKMCFSGVCTICTKNGCTYDGRSEL